MNFKYLKQKMISAQLNEIHQYTLDMDRMTLLRNKSDLDAEREQYDKIIDGMQKVLLFLNKELIGKEK